MCMDVSSSSARLLFLATAQSIESFKRHRHYRHPHRFAIKWNMAALRSITLSPPPPPLGLKTDLPEKNEPTNQHPATTIRVHQNFVSRTSLRRRHRNWRVGTQLAPHIV